MPKIKPLKDAIALAGGVTAIDFTTAQVYRSLGFGEIRANFFQEPQNGSLETLPEFARCIEQLHDEASYATSFEGNYAYFRLMSDAFNRIDATVEGKRKTPKAFDLLETVAASFEAQDLMRAIAVVISTHPKDLKGKFQGVELALSDSGFWLVCCDSHRISRSRVGDSEVQVGSHGISLEAAHFAANLGCRLAVGFSKDYAYFQSPDLVFRCPLKKVFKTMFGWHGWKLPLWFRVNGEIAGLARSLAEIAYSEVRFRGDRPLLKLSEEAGNLTIWTYKTKNSYGSGKASISVKPALKESRQVVVDGYYLAEALEAIAPGKDGVEFCLSEVELLVRCGGSDVGVMLVKVE